MAVSMAVSIELLNIFVESMIPFKHFVAILKKREKIIYFYSSRMH